MSSRRVAVDRCHIATGRATTQLRGGLVRLITVVAIAILIVGCAADASDEQHAAWCTAIGRWTQHRLASVSDPLEFVTLANEELDTLRGLEQPSAIRQDMEVFLGIDTALENRDAERRAGFRLDRIGRYVRDTCPQLSEAQVQVFNWSDPIPADD